MDSTDSPGDGKTDRGGWRERRPAADIIRDYLRAAYDPPFRRGGRLWSRTLGRDVSRADATGGAPSPLIDLLAEAREARRGEDNRAVRNALPRLFRDWAPTAWYDLLASLPDEEQTAEVVPSALEQFRQRVGAALLQPITLGMTTYVKGEEQTQTRRTSLIRACVQFAEKPPGPGWQSVRSYLLWCRPGDGVCRVALRHGLFGQLPGFKDLEALGKQRFAELARMYGVGAADKSLRVKGERAVELAPEFIGELLAGPPCDEVTTPARARACEGNGLRSSEIDVTI